MCYFFSEDFQTSPAIPSCKSSTQLRGSSWDKYWLESVNAKFSDKWKYGIFGETNWRSLTQIRSMHLRLTFEVLELGKLKIIPLKAKRNMKPFVKYSYAKWRLAKSPARKEITVKIPQKESFIYQIFIGKFSLHSSHSLFIYKDKLLMFYSVVMAAIGELAELWKTSVRFCLVCPNGTSRIRDVFSWNLILK